MITLCRRTESGVFQMYVNNSLPLSEDSALLFIIAHKIKV